VPSVIGPKDVRGMTLREGQKVAYNRSGDLCVGHIVAVAWGSVRIQPTREFSNGGRPRESRVRNTRGILVLAEIPDA
jgi:hypothetical protein